MIAYDVRAKNTAGHSRYRFWALVTSFTFMIVEILGGWLSGSLALQANAAQMLANSATLLVSLLACYLSRQPANVHYSFGYLRLTTLLAFCHALAMLVIAAVIISLALAHLIVPQPVAASSMLILASVGLFSTILVCWLRHFDEHRQNLKISPISSPLFCNLLIPLCTIIAAFLMLWCKWTAIDPLLSIVVALLIAYNAWQLLKESAHELMERAPLQIRIPQLRHDLLLAIDEVRDIHHVHIWQLGGKRIITLHAKVIPPYQHDTLLSNISDYLKQHYLIDHVTIQMEYGDCDDNLCTLQQPDEPYHADHHTR
jgi:cobalt-zinc-cadmium efflux system protein